MVALSPAELAPLPYDGEEMDHSGGNPEKSLLHRLLERITGCYFADPLDPREWECNPLHVVRRDKGPIFHRDVTVCFTPDHIDQGWAEVIGVDDPPPRIHVNRHKEVWAPRGMGYIHRGESVPVGLVLVGTDSSGEEYCWLINRAFEYVGSSLPWSYPELVNDQDLPSSPKG